MSTIKPKTRRERVKPGIYVRHNRQGRKVYEITYRDSDRRQRWETIEGGIRAAEAALADKRARIGRGERVAPIPNLTFGNAAERWQESQAARLRPATREAYGSSLRVHLLPAWRNRRLDSLTVDDVARLIESMRERDYKAWTIRESSRQPVVSSTSRSGDLAGPDRTRCGYSIALSGQHPTRSPGGS